MITARAKSLPPIYARDTLLVDAAGARVARGIITTTIADFPPVVLLDGDVFLFVAFEDGTLTYQQARVFRAGRDFR